MRHHAQLRHVMGMSLDRPSDDEWMNGWIWRIGVMIIDISRTLKNKSCPSTTSSITNPTWTLLELNPGCRGVNFATVLQVERDWSCFVQCGICMGQWISFGTCEVHVFSCEEKVTAGAQKENLFCWRFGSRAWPPIHQSEGELVGSLAARAIHEMRLSAP